MQMSRSSRKLPGWDKEVKEAKSPSSHVDEQILAMLSPAARAHIPLSDAFREGICNCRQPQLYGPTDKRATGDDKWPKIFLYRARRGRWEPLLQAEEVCLIYSADPRSFPPPTAAAVGDGAARRRTAVPRPTPHHPAEDPARWVQPWA